MIITLLLLLLLSAALGLHIQRAEVRRLKSELSGLAQAASNADALRADVRALETERAQIIRAAADRGERARRLEWAGNELSSAAKKAAAAIPGEAIRRDLIARACAWESAREGIDRG